MEETPLVDFVKICERGGYCVLKIQPHCIHIQGPEDDVPSSECKEEEKEPSPPHIRKMVSKSNTSLVRRRVSRYPKKKGIVCSKISIHMDE
jgi:hypothetical protein